MSETEQPDPTVATPTRTLEQARLAAQALQRLVYACADPTTDAALYRQLLVAQAEASCLEQATETQAAQAPRPRKQNTGFGNFLGLGTTGLKVTPIVKMQPLPTGIYHLLDEQTDPLLAVTVENARADTKRIRASAWIEGLSAETVRTVEIKGKSEVTLNMLPALFPERSRAIIELRRATLHLRVEILAYRNDDQDWFECHDTFSLVCLARTSSFNAVRDPQTKKMVDLSHYYGAWVTPYAEPVQHCIRSAAQHLPGGTLPGYQGTADGVTQQVAALFKVLKERDLRYVNSVIDFGAAPGFATQRTRLPRESLALKSANCIDGTVLFASLLEGMSLNAKLVLVPGHAFVGWQTRDAVDSWRYLETTMIGVADFAAACQAGDMQYVQQEKFNPGGMKRHVLADLRARNIWPME